MGLKWIDGATIASRRAAGILVDYWFKHMVFCISVYLKVGVGLDDDNWDCTKSVDLFGAGANRGISRNLRASRHEPRPFQLPASVGTSQQWKLSNYERLGTTRSFWGRGQ